MTFAVFLALSLPMGGSAISDHHLVGGKVDITIDEINRWELVSKELTAPCPFNEALPSWNVECPDRNGFIVEIRVSQESQGDSWSPYLRVGTWGSGIPQERGLETFEKGKVDVDIFLGSEGFRRLQYRIRGFAVDASKRAPIRVDSLFVSLSDTVGLPSNGGHSHCPGPLSHPIQINVPARSQQIQDKELAARICSPTSIAMIAEYFGKNLPTERVAEVLFDREHDIYGNWNRAIQGAYTLGVPGYLDRFCGLWEAKQLLARGTPLVISVRAQKGEFPDAPYAETIGHLLVLTGFNEAGDFLANDPAAPLAEVQRTYRAVDLEKVWLRNAKGLAYVFPHNSRKQ